MASPPSPRRGRARAPDRVRPYFLPRALRAAYLASRAALRAASSATTRAARLSSASARAAFSAAMAACFSASAARSASARSAASAPRGRSAPALRSCAPPPGCGGSRPPDDVLPPASVRLDRRYWRSSGTSRPAPSWRQVKCSAAPRNPYPSSKLPFPFLSILGREKWPLQALESSLCRRARSGGAARDPGQADAHLPARALERGATLLATARDFARFDGPTMADNVPTPSGD